MTGVTPPISVKSIHPVTRGCRANHGKNVGSTMTRNVAATSDVFATSVRPIGSRYHGASTV